MPELTLSANPREMKFPVKPSKEITPPQGNKLNLFKKGVKLRELT